MYVSGLNPIILLEWLTVNMLCVAGDEKSVRMECIHLNGEIQLYKR